MVGEARRRPYWLLLVMASLSLLLASLFISPQARGALVGFVLEQTNRVLPRHRVSVVGVDRLDPLGIRVRGLRIVTLRGDTLLYVERLAASIAPWSLVRAMLDVTELEAEGVQVYVDDRAGAAEAEKPDSAKESSFAVRVRAAVIRDAQLTLFPTSSSLRFDAPLLRGAVLWGPQRRVSLTQGVIHGGRAGTPLLHAQVGTSAWSEAAGGSVSLHGTLASAPFRLTAVLPGLEEGTPWPLTRAAFALTGVDRSTLEALGIAGGGGLVTPVALELKAERRGDALTATLALHADPHVVLLRAELTESEWRASAKVPEVVLSSISDLLPTIAARGELTLALQPKDLSVARLQWSQVGVAQWSVPDGKATLALADRRLTLRELVLTQHPDALRAAGHYSVVDHSGAVSIDLVGLPLAELAVLQDVPIAGLLHGRIDASSDGHRGLSVAASLSARELRAYGIDARQAALRGALRAGSNEPAATVSLALTEVRTGAYALGQVSLEGQLDGETIEADLRATADGMTAGMQVAGKLDRAGALRANAAGTLVAGARRLSVSLRDGRYDAPSFSVAELRIEDERGGSVRGSARMTGSGSLTSTLALRAVQLQDWVPLLRGPPIAGSVTGSLELAGSAPAPRLRVALEVDGLSVPTLPSGRAEIGLTADASSRHARLQIDWRGDAAPLRVQAKLGVHAARLESDLRALLQGATHEGSLTIQGRLERLSNHVGAAGSGLGVDVDVDVRSEGRLVAPKIAWSAVADLRAAESASGAADELRLRGAADALSLQLTLDGRDAQGPAIAGKLDLTWPESASLFARRPADLVRARTNARVELSSRRLDRVGGGLGRLLENLQLKLPARVAGVLTVQAREGQVEGSLRGRAALALDGLDGCAAGFQPRFGVSADLQAGDLRVTTELVPERGATARLDLRVPVAVHSLREPTIDVGPLRVALDATNLPVPQLPGLCRFRDGLLSLHATGELLEGSVPTARVEAEVRQLRLASAGDAVSGSVSADLSKDKLSVHAPIAVAGKQRAELRANLPLAHGDDRGITLSRQAPLAVDLSLSSVPLDIARVITGDVLPLSGVLTSDLALRGSLADPRATGKLSLVGGSISIASLAHTLEDVNAEIVLRDRDIELVSFSAHDGKGKVKLEGRLRVTDLKHAASKLKLHLEDFPIGEQGVTTALLSTNTDIEGKLDRESALRVAVTMRDGKLRLLSPEGTGGQTLWPHPDVQVVDEQPSERPPPRAEQALPIQIEIRSRRELLLIHDSFSLQAGLRLDASIDPTTRIVGRVDIPRGTVQLLGSRFDLQPGSLIFAGEVPPDPQLDLLARFQPKRGEALLVHLGGAASAPVITFSGAASTAEEAMAVLGGVGAGGTQQQFQSEASDFGAAMVTGMLSVAARRRLGNWVPMLSLETGSTTSSGRARAGFDASTYVPHFMRGFVRSAYLEGIVGGKEGTTGEHGVGFRIDMSMPMDFVSSMGYGPGSTWATDIVWTRVRQSAHNRKR